MIYGGGCPRFLEISVPEQPSPLHWGVAHAPLGAYHVGYRLVAGTPIRPGTQVCSNNMYMYVCLG